MNKIDVSLNNSEYFKLAIGKRITKKQLHEKNHGTIPVISARLDQPFGYMNSERIIQSNSRIVLWNIDSSRWDTRVLNAGTKFIPTDHCGYMFILNDKILPDYIAYKLYERGLSLGFFHEYRASLANIGDITIPIPITQDGIFDIDEQNRISSRYQTYSNLKNILIKKITDILNKKLIVSSNYKTINVSIGDITTFEKGKSIYTEKYCRTNEGKYPVYSAGTKDKVIIGSINKFDYEMECLRITTNGHYAGSVNYMSKRKFSINGDAGILYLNEGMHEQYDYLFLEYALQKAREQYGFNWNNKPIKKDIYSIIIEVPILNGKINKEEQIRIANKYANFKKSMQLLREQLNILKRSFIKID